jgi:hypothetical protein
LWAYVPEWPPGVLRDAREFCVASISPNTQWSASELLLSFPRTREPRRARFEAGIAKAASFPRKRERAGLNVAA